MSAVDFLVRQAEGLEPAARFELIARLLEGLKKEQVQTEEMLRVAYQRSEAA